MQEKTITISFEDALRLLVDGLNQHVFEKSQISTKFKDKKDLMLFMKFVLILTENDADRKHINDLAKAIMEVIE